MLTKEELQKIIDQFDEDELKRQGIFGISQYGGGSDESFIRANKKGLELFALQLLNQLETQMIFFLILRKTSFHSTIMKIGWTKTVTPSFSMLNPLLTSKK